ncbi:MAG: ABC transporter permease [Candidatus Methanoplasma sp.]|jgi:ABC-2 type transport system permease protein|nr:ABC transporter permease [Candidatus Methanoplasma sp.]
MTASEYSRQLLSLTGRELKHWYRSRMQIIVTIVQPLVWLGLFGLSAEVFVNMIESKGGLDLATTDYFSFLSVGIILSTALTTSLTSGMSVVWDRRFGFLDKLRASPVPRGVIPLSKVLASTVKATVQAMAVFAVAVALGLDVDGLTMHGVSVLLASVILIGLTFSSIFVALGTAIKSFDTYMTLNSLLSMPMMFVSGVMFPTYKFPAWLKAAADLNPLTYASDAARAACLDPEWLTPAHGFSLLSVPNLSIAEDLLVVAIGAAVVMALSLLFAGRALRAQ